MTDPPRWFVGDSPQADFTPRAAASILAGALREAIAVRGAASLAVPGGRTPAPAFKALSNEDLNWSRVAVTLVDERWVNPGSEESNERLVREHLLQGRAAEARFLPMMGNGSSPQNRVEAYVATLPPEPFDAVLLGMGEDGHFASLFPGSPVLAAGLDPGSTARAVAVPTGEGTAPPQPRLSLTLAEIARAGLIVLLASGREKQRVVEHAQAAGADPMRLPIAALLAARPDVRVLLSL